MAKKVQVITRANLGTGFSYDETEKKINVDIPSSSGGLDTSNLPTKPWKKGTKVLAEQDGNPVFIQAAGDIFTDVTLRLTAQKTHTTIVTGNTDTVNLVATVTNAGTNPASDISVVLVKPNGTGYTLGEPQLQSQYASGFVATGDTTYTIATLQSGGVATITIPVTYDKGGTYSFGGQVTSTIDTNTANNSSTVIISVTERMEVASNPTGSNYIPTADCPMFAIRDVEYGVSLKTVGMWLPTDNETRNYKDWVDSFVHNINIYGDKRSLAGRVFQLENVEQLVLVSASYSGGARGFGPKHLLPPIIRSKTTIDPYKNSLPIAATTDRSKKFAYDIAVGFAPIRDSTHTIFNRYVTVSASISQAKSLIVMGGIDVLQSDSLNMDIVLSKTISTGFTFDKDKQILSFDSSFTFDPTKSVNDTNVGGLILYAKPSGSGCRWQMCVIKFTAPLPTMERQPGNTFITHESTLGDNVTFTYRNYQDSPVSTGKDQHGGLYIDDLANWVGGEKPEDLDCFVAYTVYETLTRRKPDQHISVAITIKSGTSGSFTLTATDDRLESVTTSGNITTRYDRASKTLTVNLDSPQPQNSVTIDGVSFRVVD